MRMRAWGVALAGGILLGGCVSVATYEDQMRRCRGMNQHANEVEGKVAGLEGELAAKTAEAEELEKSIARMKATHDELVDKLQTNISDGDVAVQSSQDNLTITLGDKVLFKSGEWELQPRGQRVLDQVSDVLKKVEDRLIQVEGHTDNVPIKGPLKKRFPSNWDLSSARAAAVVRYLEKGGVNADRLVLAAYGDRHPLGDNSTEAGRRQNRRVEISLPPIPVREEKK